jgi:hypothetical protein
MSIQYYYLLFSHTDFLKNLTLEELLRERGNFYNSRKLLKDFWIVIAPQFIEKESIKKQIIQTNYYNEQIQVQEKERKEIDIKTNILEDEKTFIAIVSTNIEFITWIKLRFGSFESLGKKEKIFGLEKKKQDGIFGYFEEGKDEGKEKKQRNEKSENYDISPLLSNRVKKNSLMFF